jgi:AraC-like DNA-binding protein
LVHAKLQLVQSSLVNKARQKLTFYAIFMYGTIGVLRGIIYAAAAQGGIIDRLCGTLGISPAELNDVDRRIEGLKPTVDLWEEILSSTADPAFGLHAGRSANSSMLGMLGYLLKSGYDIRTTYHEMIKYQQMLSGWISYDYSEQDFIKITFKAHPLWLQVSEHTSQQAIEFAMSGSLQLIYLLTGQKAKPLRATLAYKGKIAKKEYEHIFTCPIQFQHNENSFIFPKDLGDLKLKSHDRSLHVSFEQILQEKHQSQQDSKLFSHLIKMRILRDFDCKIPTIDIMAMHLNISIRSLQRRLQQEQKSYRVLSLQIKQELATELLKNTHASIQSISDFLGYTEASSFVRAFKNENQTSPGKKRRSIQE